MAGHRPLTRLPTRRHIPYLDLVRLPTYSWKSEHWKNVSNCFTENCFLKLQMPCVVTSTAAKSCLQGKMLTLMIMLEMAGKCSNYARNWGLCFSFWNMLFEADYHRLKIMLEYCINAYSGAALSFCRVDRLGKGTSLHFPNSIFRTPSILFWFWCWLKASL